MTLNGKTLFITGASRGIGLAIGLRAAQDGANVVIAAKTAEPHPKLEVHRASLGKPLIHPDDPAIVAVASDAPLPAARVPVIGLDDVEGIAEFLVRHAAPVHAVPAHAERG